MRTEPNERLSISWRVLLAEFLAVAAVCLVVGGIITFEISKDRVYAAGKKQGAQEEQQRVVNNLNQFFANARMSTTRPISEIRINRSETGIDLSVMISTADQVMRATTIVPTEQYYSTGYKEHLDFEYTEPATRNQTLVRLAKDFCNPTTYSMYVPGDQKTKPRQAAPKKPPHRMKIIQQQSYKPGDKKD